MLVVLVDESTKHSRVRTRRIASKYLHQIASSTWMGNLSAEALDQLRIEVREIAKRNSVVVCFRIRSARRYEIAWTAGDTTMWDERGAFAFRMEGVLR